MCQLMWCVGCSEVTITHAPFLQPVPEKMRLEIFIQMQNEIQIGIKKLQF